MQSISEENYEKPISETNHFNLVTISKENTVSISINCLRCKSTLIAARNTQTDAHTYPGGAANRQRRGVRPQNRRIDLVHFDGGDQHPVNVAVQ